MDVKECCLVLSLLKAWVRKLLQNWRFYNFSYENLGSERKKEYFVTVLVPLNHKPGIPEFFFKIQNVII